jgi:excisionase family DNA binding protein
MFRRVPGRLARRLKTWLRRPAKRLIVCGMSLTPLPRLDSAPSAPTRPGVLPGLTRDGVLTASEVADLLHMPVSTVYQLARGGQLPACRLGRTWRFLRPRLEELLRS